MQVNVVIKAQHEPPGEFWQLDGPVNNWRTYLLVTEVSLNDYSLYFFAIEDLARAFVVLRGFGTISAITSKTVIVRPDTRCCIWALHESGLQRRVTLSRRTTGERFAIAPVLIGLSLGFDSGDDIRGVECILRNNSVEASTA